MQSVPQVNLGRPATCEDWIVDPLARTLEVLRLNGDRWTLLATSGGADRVSAEPFGQIELELPLLWDEPANA
jgi:hypothetical protein